MNFIRKSRNPHWYTLCKEETPYDENVDYFQKYIDNNNDKVYMSNIEMIQMYIEYCYEEDDYHDDFSLEMINYIKSGAFPIDVYYENYINDTCCETIAEQPFTECKTYTEDGVFWDPELYEYDYFDFVRLSNDNVKARRGLLPLNPTTVNNTKNEHYELAKNFILNRTCPGFSIHKDGKEVYRFGSKQLWSRYRYCDDPKDQIIADLTEKDFRNNINDIKKRTYKNGDYIITTKKEFDKGYWQIKFPNRSHNQGFTKRQLFDAILNSGIPIDRKKYGIFSNLTLHKHSFYETLYLMLHNNELN